MLHQTAPKETVAVVVTSYNHARYLEQCVRSVFAQTYDDIDCLIIDDGSTDSSDAIIEKLVDEAPFPCEKMILSDNIGVCAARNVGLDWIERKGYRYYLFVDSDNYLDTDFIEKLVETAEQSNADIVFTSQVDVATGEIRVQAREISFRELLRGNIIDNCSLVRLSILNGERYDVRLNRKMLVDYDLFLRLIGSHKAKAVPCFDTKINYRVLQNSVSQHGNVARWLDSYFYILLKQSTEHFELVHQVLVDYATELSQSPPIYMGDLDLQTLFKLQSKVLRNPLQIRNLSYSQIVALLYVIILGRLPDESGLKNYVAELAGGASPQSVAQALAESEEFGGRTTSEQLDAEEFLRELRTHVTD